MKKHLKLILTVLVAATLMLLLSGCGNRGQDLEGKNIVTFELGGGTLELKTSSVDTKINFAYEPGTYILDPTEIPGYKIFRQGYNFTGWYTTEECKDGDKWDFDTPFETETLTLYAGWEKAIKYTYSVNYVVDGVAIKLGTYEVSAGTTFEDWRKYAANRADHTVIGYYSDIDLRSSWDSSFKHPGGDVDTDVPVYVDYIDGTWNIVDDYAKLRTAIKSGDNVYLVADIDCGGDKLVDLSLTTTYDGIFEGNGFTVSNFTVEKSGGLRPSLSIFKTLGENCEIRNVSFTEVAYVFTDIGASVKTVKVAALANDSRGAKITNVSISGTLTTDYTGELTKLNEPVYEEEAVVEVVNFTATITVNN